MVADEASDAVVNAVEDPFLYTLTKLLADRFTRYAPFAFELAMKSVVEEFS